MVSLSETQIEQLIYKNEYLKNKQYFVYKKPLEEIYEKTPKQITSNFMTIFNKNQYTLKHYNKYKYSLCISSQNETALVILLSYGRVNN